MPLLPCAELISCLHHLSIQSAIMSSSPIKFQHVSDDDQSAAELSDVVVDTDSVETEPICAFHNANMEDEQDCYAISECEACDERERFALLDSPPLTVLSGNVELHLCTVMVGTVLQWLLLVMVVS